MRRISIYLFGLVLVASVVLLAACGSSTVPETSVPPPATLAPEPATAVPPTVAPVQPTTVPPTAVPPTAAPVQPTAVPPTAAPPTAVPAQPTAVPPTSVPPTAVPVAPTTASTNTDATGVDIPKFIPASEWKDPSPDKFTKDDVDYIFPPGKGQDLVFQGCQGCHNWVPLVVSGFDRGSWLQNKINHKERSSGLSDADYDYLYEYLIQTWPPDRPVPDGIPQELLDQWTSY